MSVKRLKTTFITSGYFPVPASLGGAVEAILENFAKVNEEKAQLDLTIYSCYDSVAFEDSKKYSNTRFKFIHIPYLIRVIDKITYLAAKHLLKKKKSFSYRYLFQRLFYIFMVALDIKRIDAGKIIIENHSSLFLVLKLFKNYQKYAGRYYYHLHNVVTSDYGCRNIIGSCKKVIGVSAYINRSLKLHLEGEDNNQYVVLRNKIDQENFAHLYSQTEKELIRQKYELLPDQRVLLFTGRFTPEKGIRELLLAFKNLQMEDVRLLIVGSYYFGSDTKNLFSGEMRELVSDMSNRVIFTGFVNYSEIPKLYAIADAVVLPSIWDDPAPLTVIEAMTSHKPLITTNSGGIPEYTSGSSTIIIQRDEQIVEHLTTEIQRVLESDTLRATMIQNLEEITRDWNIQSMYDDLYNIVK